jgi:hypothetical protein
MLGVHLEAELPQLYRATNESLVDADILPRLKRSYRDFSLVDPAAAAAESARITSALERLVKTRTAAAGAPPTPTTDPQATPSSIR